MSLLDQAEARAELKDPFFGAPFVDGIDGDPSNVLGLSLPLLRRMLGEIDVVITDLWRQSPPPARPV